MSDLFRARIWLYPEIDMPLMRRLDMVNASSWLLLALQAYVEEFEAFSTGTAKQYKMNIDLKKQAGLVAMLESAPGRRRALMLRSAAYHQLGRIAPQGLDIDDLAARLVGALRARGVQFQETAEPLDGGTIQEILKGVAQFEVG